MHYPLEQNIVSPVYGVMLITIGAFENMVIDLFLAAAGICKPLLQPLP